MALVTIPKLTATNEGITPDGAAPAWTTPVITRIEVRQTSGGSKTSGDGVLTGTLG